ncbi:glycoside hydrolase family 5 protein [Breznakiella homolactica]|uniref:Cellulase family glycosylhydrolase n=1 Tax=Breznakiella homolactica TaxID=2798577 RepID=A0A7T8BBX1_9SPIR|nr:cellulase family glycosylhydrolase [Breznakiella homolactica]QQO10520.1 cellulase family glycosylhydrolase [Breznakiella homolactica]
MKIDRSFVKDDMGRTLLLRGCNLGGDSKFPAVPEGATWHRDSLKNPETVSFAGRPFPEEEAETHFRRLARWGMTFVRFTITWEALEHAGPGIYDEAYLAYLRKIFNIAKDQGIGIFIDPHQDVWSRWTGGDGAPVWTMEKLGIIPENLDECGAAFTHQHYGDPFPRMIWPTNYNRYAAATMFTLFFGGRTYAPETEIDNENAQDCLQERYLSAMRHCYRRLKNCTAIVGWGTMNEPHPGFIGYKNLEGLENYPVAAGPVPSPLLAMAAASGHSVEFPVYVTGINGPKVTKKQAVNPQGLSLFREGYGCPWKKAGVWTDEGGSPRILKPGHFSEAGGKPVRFADDFLKPFMKRFIDRMEEAGRNTVFFIEGVPHGEHPSWEKEETAPVVNAFHWYDGATLYMKFFRPWFSFRADTGKMVLGRKNAVKSFSDQLRGGLEWTRNRMGEMPCLLGEFGLPFDMNGKKAFRTGDYRLHEEALAMYYEAVDDQLLHSTIWNYTASNTHEHGDGWNGEDLSIFSDGKGRAWKGWLRPYPMATAGTPRSFFWDRKKGRCVFTFLADGTIDAETELFMPPECLGTDPAVTVAGAGPDTVWNCDPEARRFFINHRGFSGEITLTLERQPGTPKGGAFCE